MAKSKRSKENSTSLSDAKVVNKTFLANYHIFISHNGNTDLLLIENDSIINESKSVAKILNKYWNEIVEDIKFDEPIPQNIDNYDTVLSLI